jgi:hypothetical protein
MKRNFYFFNRCLFSRIFRGFKPFSFFELTAKSAAFLFEETDNQIYVFNMKENIIEWNYNFRRKTDGYFLLGFFLV